MNGPAAVVSCACGVKLAWTVAGDEARRVRLDVRRCDCHRLHAVAFVRGRFVGSMPTAEGLGDATCRYLEPLIIAELARDAGDDPQRQADYRIASALFMDWWRRLPRWARNRGAAIVFNRFVMPRPLRARGVRIL